MDEQTELKETRQRMGGADRTVTESEGGPKQSSSKPIAFPLLPGQSRETEKSNYENDIKKLEREVHFLEKKVEGNVAGSDPNNTYQDWTGSATTPSKNNATYN